MKSKFLKMESDVAFFVAASFPGFSPTQRRQEREPGNKVAFIDMGKLLKKTTPEYLNKLATGLHPHIYTGLQADTLVRVKRGKVSLYAGC